MNEPKLRDFEFENNYRCSCGHAHEWVRGAALDYRVGPCTEKCGQACLSFSRTQEAKALSVEVNKKNGG